MRILENIIGDDFGNINLISNLRDKNLLMKEGPLTRWKQMPTGEREAALFLTLNAASAIDSFIRLKKSGIAPMSVLLKDPRLAIIGLGAGLLVSRIYKELIERV